MDYYSHLQKSARECLRGYWLRIIIAYAVWQAASALASVLIQFAVAVTGNYEDLNERDKSAYKLAAAHRL